MILSAFILIPVLLFLIYLFFTTSPKYVEKTVSRSYNLKVMTFGIIACIAVSLYSYLTTGQSIDAPWWPVFAFFGSAIVLSIVLLFGGFYRNFIYFKKQKQ